MIRFNDVHLRWQYEQFELLKGVSFTLERGINTILCESQGGKTSICKLLTKVVKPTSGSIEIDGVNLNDIPNKQLDLLYLSNKPTFFENRSVLYNVAYPLAVRKMKKAERIQQTMQLLAQYNMHCFAKTKVKKLSTEQRLLLSFLRGQNVARSIVLLDDVFEDIQLFEKYQLFSRFNQDCTVILTSNAQMQPGNVITLDNGLVV